MVSYATMAQTSTGGAIVANTVWQAANSPYTVTNDLVVQNGATLTIEAGTTVYMASATRFIIQSGTLNAVGTAQSPILFTSQKKQVSQTPAAGDWQQVIFNSGTTAATSLEHVQIEYGKGVTVNGAAPKLNNVIIANNQGAAIVTDLAASPAGTGNQAIGNTINSIVVPEGDISGSITWGLRGIPYLILSGSLSVGASPKITAVTPQSLQQGETQTITLTGSRLTGFSNPVFGASGIAAQVLQGATASQVQLQVNATASAALGSTTLSASTDAGEVKFSNALTVLSTQPKLTSVEPSTVSTNQGDVAVTLRGINFANNSVAYLDAQALTTTYVGATELTAVVPNQTVNASKTIKLRTPNPNSGGQEYVSNDLLLTVITPPPVITAIAPDAIRRGESKSFEITGTGLSATQISASDSALAIGNLVSTSTKANFNISAAANAPLGKRQLTLTSAGGSASINVTVNPALPVAMVAPTPIAVPPDGSTRQFAIQLSFSDTESHTFSVVLGDTSIATAVASSLTIAAGQIQVVGGIKGIKSGVTSLTLTSATLGTLSVPVYVTSDFVGLNTSTAPLLGVVLTPPPTPPAQNAISPAASQVGVVLGSVIQSMSPKAFSVGGDPRALTISGVGLQEAVAVSIKPADGVTVGSVVVAQDGKSITVQLTVASDAPVTMRQIVVVSAGGIAYPVAQPDADRILITLPTPEIYSIEPLFGTPGTSSLSLLVRGRNLQSAQSLNFSPADGITVGSTLAVNGDGTQLTAGLAIAQSASLGPRKITITTPASTSNESAGAANVFTVVNQLVNNVTPITAPLLGVVKQDATVVPSQTLPLFSRSLGVTLGSTARAISPKAKAIGETFTLSIQGIGLQGVTGVSFVPNTGIAVAAPAIAEDGLSLTIQVSIAADAPQTMRTLQLSAGVAPILFINPAAAIFTVTAPQPVIASTDPKAIQLGAAPVLMTIRGQNFQNAQNVRFVPPDGITVSTPPTVNANATELTVSVSAISSAAPGSRAVIVTTPGGESPAELTVANTVSFGSTISSTGLVAPLLGVVKQEAAAPQSLTYGPIVAANLGVNFNDAAPPPATNRFTFARSVGVTLGSAAIAVQPNAMAVSSSGTLSVNGVALESVSGISIDPPQGITFDGPLQVSPDGSQITAPVSVAVDAAKTLRQVVLSTATGKVTFASPAASTLQITSNTQPQLSSISPILSTAGSLLTLTVRGQDLHNVTAVTASPAAGLTFDAQPVVNSTGTELTVRVQIANDAPLTSRVIQVVTPAFASSPTPSPANTFTVYAQ